MWMSGRFPWLFIDSRWSWSKRAPGVLGLATRRMQPGGMKASPLSPRVLRGNEPVSFVWGGAELDGMPVGIDDVDLVDPVGACAAGVEVDSEGFEMLFPGGDVIDSEGVVILAGAGGDGVGAFADQVEFLFGAKAEPGSGEGEGRSFHWFKLQNGAVEIAALFDVLDVNGDVIEFENFHVVLLFSVG